MSLAKKFRLRLQRDFDSFLADSRSVSTPEMTLKFRPNQLDVGRLAVIAGKKTAKKATVRNKIRRRLKEIVRLKINRFSGWDMILIIRSEALKKNFAELKEIVERLMSKIK